MSGIESIPLATLVQILTTLGPFGLLLVLWWLDTKNLRALVESHRAEVAKILEQYKDSHSEVRKMYENNVVLVEQTQSLAKSLKDLVVLNIESSTRLSDDIRHNQYCPVARVDKRKEIHAVKEA